MADTTQRTRARATKPDDGDVEQTLGDGDTATAVTDRRGAREAKAKKAREAAREAAVQEGLEEIRHLRGCPAKGVMEINREAPERIEVIEHHAKADPSIWAAQMQPNVDRDRVAVDVEAIIVRCVECGAQYPDE